MKKDVIDELIGRGQFALGFYHTNDFKIFFKPTCPLSAGADVAPDMSTTARMIRHIFPNPCQEKLLLSQRWRFVTVELLDENPPFPQVKKKVVEILKIENV